MGNIWDKYGKNMGKCLETCGFMNFKWCFYVKMPRKMGKCLERCGWNGVYMWQCLETSGLDGIDRRGLSWLAWERTNWWENVEKSCDIKFFVTILDWYGNSSSMHGGSAGIAEDFFGLPSGEHTFCHGKSPFLMGKSTISMAIFHCYGTVHQRVFHWNFPSPICRWAPAAPILEILRLCVTDLYVCDGIPRVFFLNPGKQTDDYSDYSWKTNFGWIFWSTTQKRLMYIYIYVLFFLLGGCYNLGPVNEDFINMVMRSSKNGDIAHSWYISVNLRWVV